MQPNNYYGFGVNPTAAPQQPQPMSARQPAMNTGPVKKRNGLVPVVIILLLVCIGLGAGLAVVVMNQKPEQPVVVESAPNSITTPLSELKLSETDTDREKEISTALANRVFSSTVTNEQTIEFTSNTEYVYTYYKDRANDYRKVQPSTANGTFKVKGDVISLSSGDSFRIDGDYLIKQNTGLTDDSNTIYFDLYQTKTSAPSIAAAYNSYIIKQVKANQGSVPVEKAVIDFSTIICKVGDNHLTNADNYYCDIDTTIYLSKKDADQAVEDSQKTDDTKKTEEKKDEKKPVYKDFLSYCKATVEIAEFSKGGTCNDDYSVTSKASIIVRISDGEYRVTGLFH